MAQQFDYPKNETDLRDTLDALYLEAKTAKDGGKRPSFEGLIELMSSEVTIKREVKRQALMAGECRRIILRSPMNG